MAYGRPHSETNTNSNNIGVSIKTRRLRLCCSSVPWKVGISKEWPNWYRDTTTRHSLSGGKTKMESLRDISKSSGSTLRTSQTNISMGWRMKWGKILRKARIVTIFRRKWPKKYCKSTKITRKTKPYSIHLHFLILERRKNWGRRLSTLPNRSGWCRSNFNRCSSCITNKWCSIICSRCRQCIMDRCRKCHFKWSSSTMGRQERGSLTIQASRWIPYQKIKRLTKIRIQNDCCICLIL